MSSSLLEFLPASENETDEDRSIGEKHSNFSVLLYIHDSPQKRMKIWRSDQSRKLLYLLNKKIHICEELIRQRIWFGDNKW